MRLIVRNSYPVHVWNVSDYIKQTQANVIRQDSNHYITMQNIFKKLYLRQLSNHHVVSKHTRKLNNMVVMSETPARAIADYFHKKSNQYYEDFMRTTFEHIAKAHHISKSDHEGTLDNLGYKLFLSSEFSNLSEELKYALKNNKINFNNVVSIVKALNTMEYVDYEIFNMLLLYVSLAIGRQNGKLCAPIPTLL
jgi:hypothetical protein